MKLNQDTAAANIEFGIEIETIVPANSQVNIGGYHHGNPVTSGHTPLGQLIPAPAFNGNYWRAERDGSIQAEAGYVPCEFVSPRLRGAAGLACLKDFLAFANAIGAKVNASTGLHITINAYSVIGTTDPVRLAEFVGKLARHARAHTWAIYAQTGTARHTNRYCGQLLAEWGEKFDAARKGNASMALRQIALNFDRYRMLNFKNVETGRIEFRAFAGTLNEGQIFHHLATVFALCRKAHTAGAIPKYIRSKRVKLTKAQDAVHRLWRVMGWRNATSTVEVALGLFGPLYTQFDAYRKTAMRMADHFEQNFPSANL